MGLNRHVGGGGFGHSEKGQMGDWDSPCPLSQAPLRCSRSCRVFSPGSFAAIVGRPFKISDDTFDIAFSRYGVDMLS